MCNLLDDSHNPLEHKMGVIRTQNYQAEKVPTKSEGRKEQNHIRGALKTTTAKINLLVVMETQESLTFLR